MFWVIGFLTTMMGVIYSVQNVVLNVTDGKDSYWWLPKLLIGSIFTLKIAIICYHVFWTDKIYLQKKFSIINDLSIVHQCFSTLACDQETWNQLTPQERELKISELNGSLRFYFSYIPDLFIVQLVLFFLGWIFITDTNHQHFIIFYVTFSIFEFIFSTIPTLTMTLIYYLKNEWNQSSTNTMIAINS